MGQWTVVPDVLSRTPSHSAPPDMIFIVKVSITIAPLAFMPVDLAQIGISHMDVREFICKAQNQTTPDASRVWHIVENGFLFRSIPDGQKKQKLQLVIPSIHHKAILQIYRILVEEIFTRLETPAYLLSDWRTE